MNDIVSNILEEGYESDVVRYQEIVMDFIAVKDLKAPAQLRKRLEAAGEIVVTNNGHPMAVMVAVDNADQVETLIQTLRQARARVALTRLRSAARKKGADRLSSREIEGEIRSARQARRK